MIRLRENGTYLVVSEKTKSVTITDAPESKAQLNQCATVRGEY